MNDDAYNALYRAALKADDDYDAAIRAQFGPRATRWDHDKSKYNAATAEAYSVKVEIDKTWLAAMRRRAS